MNGAEMGFAGSLIAIVAFVLGNARAEANKRANIYTKIDEERIKSELTFVRKDVCGKEHQAVKDTLIRLEKKVDALLENGKH